MTPKRPRTLTAGEWAIIREMWSNGLPSDTSVARLLGEVTEERAVSDELAAALQGFYGAMNAHGQWDDSCFYYNGRSATELQRPIEMASAALARWSGAKESDAERP